MQTKRGEVILAAFVLAVLSISLISASGVSSPYWSDRPLTLVKGGSTVVDLTLQNMVGTEDITYKAIITDGADIASLDSDIYNVPANTANTIAKLAINLPKNATVGEARNINVEFKTMSATSSGMVAMGTGATISFQVIVAQEPRFKMSPMFTTIIIAIVILALILVIVLLRRKHSKKK